MKFSSERLESPPPKPPRRRYSDQLSVSSSGTYSCRKTSYESQRNDLKINRCSPKPAYLSLPTNLTSSVPIECEDASKLHLGAPNPRNESKYFEPEYFKKLFPENLLFSECDVNQAFESKRSFNKEKILNEETEIGHMFSKLLHENFTPCIANELSKNPLHNKMPVTNIHVNQNLKSFQKECHRRHHSDPAISYFNLQNDNLLKQDCKQPRDFASLSSKKHSNYCDSAECPCCKKSYLIVQEIKIMKEINEKLWQQICSLQFSLENIRKNTYEENNEVSVSGLLSSIYYAQKARDIAMEDRLKVTLEERNAAIKELQELITILSKHFKYGDSEKKIDMDVEKLLAEMGCSNNPSKFLKYQRILLGQIHCFKESKQDCLSHKLKQTMTERDNALEKVKKLEAETEDLKHSYGLWHSDNKHWELTMLDILRQVMQQRDNILSRVDNGLDLYNAVNRQPQANKLEPEEHQNISLFESWPKAFESAKSNQLMQFRQHSTSTSDEVIKLKEELLLLNKAFEGEKKKREQTETKCLKLERLVHILRKKLNGQNVGVPV